MRIQPDFPQIAERARAENVLRLSCRGLDQLDIWLYDNRYVSDPYEAHYVRERICLIPCDTYESYASQVLQYLQALGEQIIRQDNVDEDEKRRYLHEILAAVRQAESEAGKNAENELSILLNDAIDRIKQNRRDKTESSNDVVELPKNGTLYVVGDIHGDAHTAKLLTRYLGREIEDNCETTYAVFLGDYVNNGLQSVATLLEVLRFQKHYPGNVVLLSGNHEGPETYATAIAEFFHVHWGQWRRFSQTTSPTFKAPPRHYGHLRLDLIQRFGITAGETTYRAFAQWGRLLPFLVVSQKGIFVSHSVGLRPGSALVRSDFECAKQDQADVRNLEAIGFEAWKREQSTLHSQMVNNRVIKREMLDKLNDIFGSNVFVVGHTHYRSGDRDGFDQMSRLPATKNGLLVTLCSSYPRSPDAGHYIAYEFEASRRKEAISQGREGVAFPCIARFNEEQVDFIMETNILPLFDIL
jgi:hypothetical protein